MEIYFKINLLDSCHNWYQNDLCSVNMFLTLFLVESSKVNPVFNPII